MNIKLSLKIKLSNHVVLSIFGAAIHLPLKPLHKLQLHYSTGIHNLTINEEKTKLQLFTTTTTFLFN